MKSQMDVKECQGFRGSMGDNQSTGSGVEVVEGMG